MLWGISLLSCQETIGSHTETDDAPSDDPSGHLCCQGDRDATARYLEAGRGREGQREHAQGAAEVKHPAANHEAVVAHWSGGL